MEEKFYSPQHNTDEFSPEHLDRVAVSYFQDLGLDWGQLHAKAILDVGAGIAHFARAARYHGMAVTSVDIEPGGMGNEGGAPTDVPYLVADFRKGVPLPDESYDLIIGRASIPSMVEVREDMEAVLHEAKRLLRFGGEFRFGPDGPWIRPLRAGQLDKWFELLEKVQQGRMLSAEEDSWRRLIWPGYEREQARGEELQKMLPAEQVRARARHTLEDLRALDPSIAEHRVRRIAEWPGKDYQQQSRESAYYIVTK